MCTLYVTGHVGGLTDAFQAFVLPPLIYIYAECGRELSVGSKTGYTMIFVWGTCACVYYHTIILNYHTMCIHANYNILCIYRMLHDVIHCSQGVY